MLAASRDVFDTKMPTLELGPRVGDTYSGAEKLPSSIAADPLPKLRRMDVLEGLALARHFCPRLVAVLILAALIFFPKPSYGLIEAAARSRAQEFTSLLLHAVLPVDKPHGGGGSGGSRRGPTGAPTGAPLSEQPRYARP